MMLAGDVVVMMSPRADVAIDDINRSKSGTWQHVKKSDGVWRHVWCVACLIESLSGA